MLFQSAKDGRQPGIAIAKAVFVCEQVLFGRGRASKSRGPQHAALVYRHGGHPPKFPQANHAGERALSDFLLSPKVQSFLLDFSRETTANHPLFFPVNTAQL